MFITCPKCKYPRKPTDTGDAGICPSCGLVYAKWVQRQMGAEVVRSRPAAAVDETESRPTLRQRLTYVAERTDGLALWGHAVIYVVFLSGAGISYCWIFGVAKLASRSCIG